MAVSGVLILNVYTILSSQLLLTSFVTAICTLHDGVRYFILENAVAFMLGSWLMAFFILLVLLISQTIRTTSPDNMLFFSMFSTCMGLSLGSLGAMYYEIGLGNTLLLALASTIVIFVTLTIYAFITQINFDFLAGGLWCLLSISLFWAIISLCFGWRDGFFQAILGTIIFCMYILVDTGRLINGGQTDAILIAIGLYLDFLNLFVNLLQLLSESENRKFKEKKRK